MGRQDRIARGFRAHLCNSCSGGIDPTRPKTFDPKCAGCAEKLARGLRTGKEPAPSHRLGEKRIDHKWRAQQKALMAEARARAGMR